MKSSIRISRGGRSITFRGGAARAAFEAMTGTKLAASRHPTECWRCNWQGALADNDPCPICKKTDQLHADEVG